MNVRTVLTFLMVFAVALSGCSKDPAKESTQTTDVPDEIDQNQVDELTDEIVSKFPRRFSFPGQEALPEARFYLNGSLEPGDATQAIEFPNDYSAGPHLNKMLIPYDVSEHVPVGQPVEMRVKLKWSGDPGASADLDIYAQVPGTHDAFDKDSFDESMNWNIVTKFRVINTVRAADQPFELGVEVTNGKILDSSGVDYSIQVDLFFPDRVLAPGVAYAIQVPGNASRILFESEPVEGDEHITGEFMVIDPQDRLLRHFVYDDIGVDTRLVTVREAGEYIVYAPHLHGGFLKVSTDVPNEQFEARILTRTVEDVELASGAVGPTGSVGTFDIASQPLEMHAWIVSDQGAMANAALNLTSPQGWATTVSMAETKYPHLVFVNLGRGPAPVLVEAGDSGNVGARWQHDYNNANLAAGTWDWNAEGGAAANVSLGYTVVTYSR